MTTDTLIGKDRPATKPERQVFSEIEALLEGLRVYIHVLDIDRAGQKLNEIKEGLQQLSPEPEPDPTPRTVTGPALEDLMEAPANSILHRERGTYGHPVTKLPNEKWAIVGTIGGRREIVGYYLAEELSGLSQRVLEYPAE